MALRLILSVFLFVSSVIHIPQGEFINDDINQQEHKELRGEDDRSVELRERKRRRRGRQMRSG